jgi:NAD(P)-dependent dehydrogenase (short-subunit alcohol dehydrogenase family)
MRLKDRVAIVVGAGQSPGEGIGNGRATALTFAREGAKVLCVDYNPASAQETVDQIAAKGGIAAAFKADVTKNAELKAMVADAQTRWGRVDILHNNVGRRCRVAGDIGGSLRPLRRDQPEELRLGRAARDPDHAAAKERRDH